ncbi:MAG: hypothetical protein IID37_05735 [Planctomycetes bacterium]|nr:hypothetical protein [Planctomycetota bacterium]
MTTIGKYATALVVVAAGVCTLTDSALAKRNSKVDQNPGRESAGLADSSSDPDMTSRGVICDSPAQCDGDANGDGMVDPLDTGAILARFGLDPCAEANCQYDVNCDGMLDPLDTGYVLARFGVCNPVPECSTPGCAPEVPANDNCVDAIEAFLGDTAYNTDGASDDGPADCDPDTGHSDIWFFHEVTSDGNIEFGQCNSTDPDYDATISVYDGTSCPVGAPLACSDDGCGAVGGPGVVTIFDAEVGDILLIRVGGWNDGSDPELDEFETGDGILTIRDHGGPCCLAHDLPGCDFVEEGDAAEVEACVCAIDSFCCDMVWDSACALFVQQFDCGICLANDACEDNIPIEDGLNPYSTVLATTDGEQVPDPECDEGNGFNLDNDIWYCYTSPCSGTATFSTCNDGDENTGEADYDSRFAAYLGCACPATNDNLVACNDDGPGCADFSSIMDVPVTAGTDYLIRVGAWNGDSGTGVVAVSCD